MDIGCVHYVRTTGRYFRLIGTCKEPSAHRPGMGNGFAIVYVGLLWAATAVAVWYNASTRDRDERLWSVATLLTGVFGAVVYLLVITADDPDTWTAGVPVPGADAGDGGSIAGIAYERRRSEQRELLESLESYLESTGGADAEAIRDALYPEHPIGFESADGWWTEFVEPTLEANDYVETDGDTYRLAR